MAISINGVTVAGIGKDGKDATVNGVNALNIETTGGITGQQSDSTYTIDGSGLIPKTGGEVSGALKFSTDKEAAISNSSEKCQLLVQEDFNPLTNTLGGFHFVVNGKLAFHIEDSGQVRMPPLYTPKVDWDVVNKQYVDDIVGNINAPKKFTISLEASGWQSNQKTITVEGITTENIVFLSPASKADADTWIAAGVWCTGQGTNSLTFSCESTPSSAIGLNLVILEAAT